MSATGTLDRSGLPADRRGANRRLAWVLAVIAAAFYAGIILYYT